VSVIVSFIKIIYYIAGDVIITIHKWFFHINHQQLEQCDDDDDVGGDSLTFFQT